MIISVRRHFARAFLELTQDECKGKKLLLLLLLLLHALIASSLLFSLLHSILFASSFSHGFTCEH
jgi:hypothetical protein